MPGLSTRSLQPTDLPAVEALFDETIGRGFWDPSRDLDDLVIVAIEDGRLIGAASATVEPATAESGESVGHVRLVAVQPAARGRGIATRLVSETTALCEERGAAYTVAYAWVHGREGTAPLSGALARNGYRCERRIEDFYSAAASHPCPACGLSPCVCPADVYRRHAKTDEVIVYIAASLDGYIARSDGSIDWLDVAGPEEAEQGMADFQTLLGSVDCLVMGRATFQTVQGFAEWPYGSLPVIVLSSTLTELPRIEGANITVRSARPSDLLRELHDEGLRRIYVDGGVTIHGFMRDDLVDRLTVATIPILLGSGRPLFPEMERELHFRLESSVCSASGIVKSTYVRAR